MELTCVENIPAGSGVAIKRNDGSYGMLAYLWRGSSSRQLDLGMIGVAKQDLVKGDVIIVTNNSDGGGLKISKKRRLSVVRDSTEVLSAESDIPITRYEEKPEPPGRWGDWTRKPLGVDYSQENVSPLVMSFPAKTLRAELEERLKKAEEIRDNKIEELREAEKIVLQLSAAIGGLSVLD